MSQAPEGTCIVSQNVPSGLTVSIVSVWCWNPLLRRYDQVSLIPADDNSTHLYPRLWFVHCKVNSLLPLFTPHSLPTLLICCCSCYFITTVTSSPQPKPVDQNDDMTQLDPDWQVSKKCIKERTAVMFNNELIADVHFIVGSGLTRRRIPAHKFILSTGSPVFYAMFYGGLVGDREEVTIPDVEPQAFLNILRRVFYRST